MEATIRTKYDIGQSVYMWAYGYKKVFSVKIHMVKPQWSPYGFYINYDVYSDEIDYLADCGEDCLYSTMAEVEEAMEEYEKYR